MKRIRKAIIPAAGLGTRFLPVTKSIPKEMLPIVDAPIIYWVVREAVKAGIEDIILIAGRGKSAIEDFFDVSYEVQDQLVKAGKEELLQKILEVQNMANIISVRQKEALGLGHAVYCGHHIVGDEPFAVLLGDEITLEQPKNVTQLLCDSYHEDSTSAVAVMEVPEADVCKYGIVEATSIQEGLYKVSDVIEKPDIDKAPSRLALPGRYAFSSKIFDYLRNAKPGKNGEIQLTDAMVKLAQNDGLKALTFESTRYDAGDKLGYLIANIEFALKDDKLSASFKDYLKKLSEKL